MRLKRIKVENFRSVQALEIELPQVCAIVGPNNAGKSNILEAMRRVLGSDWAPRVSSFSEDDVYLRDAELDVTIECSFEPPIEYRKLVMPSKSRRCNSSTPATNGVRRPGPAA
jgi:putative ATP-dependent endonuclease of the OLD family